MSPVSDMQGLSDLSQCAYALGMAFGHQAQAETDFRRKVEYVELYDRCFHGFRVAVALKLRLARAAPLREREPADAEDLRDRPDPVETGRERLDYDRDRDREAASLPILLKTLGGVVAGAEALPGPPPAELPTLRELLARMTPPPAAKASRAPPGGVALLTRPPAAASPGPGVRSRLLLGGASPYLPGRTPDPGRATGPPGG